MSEISEEIKREVGQHFVFGFHGHQVSEDVKVLIRDYYVGSIILMKRNVKDTKQVRALVRELQALAKESGHAKPLLIGIDQENGLVSAFSSPSAGTQFPGAMALAATGSTHLAKKASSASAQELKLVGINWAYSPVVDVNSDSRNPVIGVRSFGDDPTEVGRYAIAVSHGLASAGIAPSAKHFPGHGDTHVDSHLALPRILKTKDALWETELPPFKELVRDGVASIMTGHMALPLITGSDTPSSLSRELTTGLLRQELGYDGVIVTDCLEMDAIADAAQGGCGVEEGAVRALEAGADVVMACHTFKWQVGAVEAAYEAVKAGRLDREELVLSGGRIAKMKDCFAGSWDEVLSKEDAAGFDKVWEQLKVQNAVTSLETYKRSTAVIWDRAGVLPLTTAGDVLLFTPQMESLNRAVDDAEGVQRNVQGAVKNTAGASYLALARAVEKRAKCRHVIYAPDEKFEPELLDRASAVIFVMRNADRATWQKSYLRMVLRSADIPTVLVASCGPYDMAGLDGEMGVGRTAYVATFEFTAAAFEVAVGVMFGEEAGRGKAPVKMAVD